MSKLLLLFLFFCLVGCDSGTNTPSPPTDTTVLSTWDGVLQTNLYDGSSEVVRISTQYTQYNYYNSSYNQRVVNKILVRNMSLDTIDVTITVVQGASYRSTTIYDMMPGEYRTVEVWWPFSNMIYISQECYYEIVTPSGLG